jgi:hypothetical protein
MGILCLNGESSCTLKSLKIELGRGSFSEKIALNMERADFMVVGAPPPRSACSYFWCDGEWVGQMGIATRFATKEDAEKYLSSNRTCMEARRC